MEIEQHYAENQQKTAVAQGGAISIPASAPSATPPPAANELVRVEQAIAIRPPPTAPVVAKNEKLANPTPPPKGETGQETETRIPASGSDSGAASDCTETRCSKCDALHRGVCSDASETFVWLHQRQPRTPPMLKLSAVAQAASVPTATPVPVLPAQPAPPDASNVALASNAGGGSWKTFSPGKMPLGRLIGDRRSA